MSPNSKKSKIDNIALKGDPKRMPPPRSKSAAVSRRRKGNEFDDLKDLSE